MPYKGKDGTCNTDVQSAISGFTLSGTQNLAAGDTAMLAAVADQEIGVISVAIGVVSSFYSYSVSSDLRGQLGASRTSSYTLSPGF